MTQTRENESAGNEIRIVRTFDAPRERVFREWIEPESVAAWFAPDGYEVTASETEPHPGGKWKVHFVSTKKGNGYTEFGEYIEVHAPEKLVFSLTQRADDGSSGPRTVVRVHLADMGLRTEMTFVQTGFTSASQRNGNAEGWGECFGKLERQLAAKT
ncbi:SRPBCC domain-containing protein [Pendulispora rubella]|uniref:SRPBCC domain-containing protein n=1 Tax=Pendulispora rubella TaxID=2741070 RepID=A0ABZ2L5A2_9BACT